MTILAAKIRKLDDGANEYLASKMSPSGGGSAFMQRALLTVPRQ
jgi:hypothetical protein